MRGEWYRAWRGAELRSGRGKGGRRTLDVVLAVLGFGVLAVLLAPLLRML